MHDLLKATLKSVMPPALLRALRPQRRHADVWGGARYGLHGLRLPGGRHFVYRPSTADRMVCEQIFFKRDYATDHLARSKEIGDFYETCADPIIVDAGANMGAAAVWFALTYPNAKVLAVEPDAANYGLLKLNTASFPSVLPLNAAIAANSGTLYLNDPGVGAWGYRTAEQPGERSNAVEAMTLEQVLAKSSGTPFILKIDIEGAESDLFSRHTAVLDRFPLVIIELHDWMLPRESTSLNFLKWHVEMKRDFINCGENIFSISNTMNSGAR